jgi:predicted signal transduction protein with EAL and GGDEF domain
LIFHREHHSVEILGQADQALYHAKRHGRNLVCFYEDLMASGALPATSLAQGEVDLF